MSNALAGKKVSTANERFYCSPILIFSCIFISCSCWITDSSSSESWVSAAIWPAWMWRSPIASAFIFSTSFFQLVKGLLVHSPLVCSSDLSEGNVFQILKNAPWQLTSYSSQLKSFSQDLSYFPLLDLLWYMYFEYFFGGDNSRIQGFLLGASSIFLLQSHHYYWYYSS